MFKIDQNPREVAALAGSAAPQLVPQWFAAYTTTRHEKAVAEHLAMRDIEAFLPLYKT